MSAFAQRTATITAAAVLLGTIPIGAGVPAQAAPASTLAAISSVESDTITHSVGDLTAAFQIIESIPDAVLEEGDGATERWIASNRPELLKAARGSIIGCTGAIAMVVASTLFPAAKLLKIKQLINSLGGVAKAVRIYWGASFNYEKISHLGGAAAALGAELLGVTAVRNNCFR